MKIKQIRQYITFSLLTLLGVMGNQNLILAQSKINPIKYIKHGTNFGMCKGYCFNETQIDSIRTILYSKSRNKGLKNNDQDKMDTLKSETSKWNLLIKNIDLNTFYQLPKKMGCPDCNDGGKEWIEIGTENKIYKVEFEYGKEIESIKDFLKILRDKN